MVDALSRGRQPTEQGLIACVIGPLTEHPKAEGHITKTINKCSHSNTDMVRYTIGIINYNMSDTLERSLRSVLEQVTEEYEVLVVDGGSTDGSLEILSRLSDEYGKLRYLISPYGCKSNRGTDRSLSVSEANGTYVLTHIDVDDRYYDVICDFVKLFHEIETQLEPELLLWGSHMAIASKDHLLRLGSYRNLNAGEDMDLFRRAIASDATIYMELESDRCWESIGYSRDRVAKILYMLEIHTCDFQAGIPLRNSLIRGLEIDDNRKRLLYFLLILVAYLRAARREQFEPAEGVRDKGLQIFKEHRYTVKEIEDKYDISIDRSILSEEGRKYLLKNDEEEA